MRKMSLDKAIRVLSVMWQREQRRALTDDLQTTIEHQEQMDALEMAINVLQEKNS